MPATGLRHLFGDLRPPLVVYVSCNPEALASELPAMREQFTIVRVNLWTCFRTRRTSRAWWSFASAQGLRCLKSLGCKCLECNVPRVPRRALAVAPEA
jgi:hypothetical protein